VGRARGAATRKRWRSAIASTGIDIRKGLQYECIACAACIDACDGVMDKLRSPRGLIRYATQHSIEGGKTRTARPRILVYAAILATLCVAFVVALLARTPVELDVIRDRNALYRESRPGFVENVYTLRIINKSDAGRVFTLRAAGVPTLEIETDPAHIAVGAGEVATVAARALVEDGAAASGGHTIEFTATATDDSRVTTTERGRLFLP
jgi:polyferredoxin